ncbi:HTH-type transcriptional activator RhaS [Dyadobacter sp. CECT 9275]|uniref:HTH-type transcriptional activator RhaS n=1 Tax=Dyadobacter helix TaxID=2822344 RepID=A0A916J8W9_9BACT|nr:AraC family transcriptional regulator [Dyadobacter sp. CECT 9275]CAG4990735.1 HTH-type transcriptional activator RhaS [Dyadobacter sp. CECT 9275]
MSGNIPVHTLPKSQYIIPALKIYRFKNSLGIQKESPVTLPITPLPTDEPHRHTYYEILFIEEGQGFHEIDFHSVPIQGPGLHFLTPGQVHLLHFNTHCQGFIVAFSEEFYSFYNPAAPSLTKFTFFQPAKRQSVIPLSETERHYFHNIMENMVTEHLAADTDPSLIGKYLGILLQKCGMIRQLRPLQDTTVTGSVPELVGRFQELVEKNFLQWHEVQQYAQQLSVSPDYLSKIVRKYLAISSQEYILDKLLLEAKRLLVFTQLSSKEIAYHIQMDDPSYFGRIFKKKCGLTPNEYRELVRKSTI